MASAMRAILLILLLGTAAGCSQDGGETDGSKTPREGPQGFRIWPEPLGVPELTFVDRNDAPLNLTDFEGKVVLLNVWATWCPPCVEEMPMLDRLQAELGGADFEVMTLSIDQAGTQVVKDFYGKVDLQHLDIYIDKTGQAAITLGAVGIPTTILIGRGGMELGRLVGAAEWDAPDMVEFLREIIEEGPR